MPFYPERRTFLKATGALLPYHWLRSGVTIPGAAALLQAVSVPVSSSDVIANPITTDSNLITVDSALININGQSSPVSGGGPLTFNSVSPNVWAPGGMVQLTINGAGFEAGSTVKVCRNGLSINNVTILDSNTIMAEVNIPANQAEGSCSVRINNPDGERVIARDVITIIVSETAPPPAASGPLAFSSVSPNVWVPGGMVQLTINGAGFEAGSTVKVCRNSLSINNVTILDSNTIMAEVNIPANQAEGSCSVRINNPDGERVIARDVITISAA